MTFYGRTEEIRLLQPSGKTLRARLIAIYGRRRVGKTALVEQAFKDKIIWKFEGLEGVAPEAQIENFRYQLNRYAGKRPFAVETPSKSASWHLAFDELVEQVEKMKSTKRLIIFLDEFQWLAGMRTNLVSLFKMYWDNHFAKMNNIDVVICGSISSFIVKKVIRSKALYGRLSIEIDLQPLRLYEAKNFFPANRRSLQEITEILMFTGGIPEYLQHIDPDHSLLQILNESAFSPRGYFFNEYQRLFISHFGIKPIYERIIACIGSSEYTPEQIANKLGLTSGGRLSSHLQDLVDAGFVEKYSPVDKPLASKLVRYRIKDNYLHFYFQFIYRHQQAILSGHYTAFEIFQSKQYQQWMGYAFERLVRENAAAIADLLRFSGINYSAGSWFRRSTSDKPGAQVDLMFVRADRVITLCEIKYSDHLSTKKLTESVEKKIEALRESFPRYGFQPVLISGKAPQSAQGYFSRVLTLEDLFSPPGQFA